MAAGKQARHHSEQDTQQRASHREQAAERDIALSPLLSQQRIITGQGEEDSSTQLQQSLGNRAVGKLLNPRTSRPGQAPLVVQPKLMIGQPNDRYEQEADRVARQVVQRMNAPQKKPQESMEEERRAELSGGVTEGMEAFDGMERKKTRKREKVKQNGANRLNGRGLPEHLKAGIEELSGYSMDEVKVHYNSSYPKDLFAHAFTRGENIYLARGQEKYLPHEAWHVVQQKTGRVRPTMQFRGNEQINADVNLEVEADIMGARALQLGEIQCRRGVQQEHYRNGQTLPLVTQLLGKIRFNNLKKGKENLRKADQIKKILTHSTEMQSYLKDRDCIITIEQNDETKSTPAYVVEVAGQVQVTLANWFFYDAPIGEIVGMLAHEFAVHPMGNWSLGEDLLAQEEKMSASDAEMKTGYEKKPWLGFLGSKSEAWHVHTDRTNQRDHLFMAMRGAHRAEFYRKVAFDLILQLLRFAKSEEENGISITDVKEAINYYFADVARTFVTNDHASELTKPEKLQHIPSAIDQVREDWKALCDERGDEGREIFTLSPTGFTVKGYWQGIRMLTRIESQEKWKEIENDGTEEKSSDGFSSAQITTIQELKWYELLTAIETETSNPMTLREIAKSLFNLSPDDEFPGSFWTDMATMSNVPSDALPVDTTEEITEVGVKLTQKLIQETHMHRTVTLIRWDGRISGDPPSKGGFIFLEQAGRNRWKCYLVG